LKFSSGKNIAEIFREFKGNSKDGTNKIARLKEMTYDGNLTVLNMCTLATITTE